MANKLKREHMKKLRALVDQSKGRWTDDIEQWCLNVFTAPKDLSIFADEVLMEIIVKRSIFNLGVDKNDLSALIKTVPRHSWNKKNVGTYATPCSDYVDADDVYDLYQNGCQWHTNSHTYPKLLLSANPLHHQLMKQVLENHSQGDKINWLCWGAFNDTTVMMDTVIDVNDLFSGNMINDASRILMSHDDVMLDALSQKINENNRKKLIDAMLNARLFMMNVSGVAHYSHISGQFTKDTEELMEKLTPFFKKENDVSQKKYIKMIKKHGLPLGGFLGSMHTNDIITKSLPDVSKSSTIKKKM